MGGGERGVLGVEKGCVSTGCGPRYVPSLPTRVVSAPGRKTGVVVSSCRTRRESLSGPSTDHIPGRRGGLRIKIPTSQRPSVGDIAARRERPAAQQKRRSDGRRPQMATPPSVPGDDTNHDQGRKVDRGPYHKQVAGRLVGGHFSAPSECE